MQTIVENLRTVRDRRIEERNAEDPNTSWRQTAERIRGTISGDDILNALVGSEQYLTAAMLKDDAQLIGKMVLAARDAMVERLTHSELVGERGLDRLATDEQAIALAFIAGAQL